MHPVVRGELACGTLKGRDRFLADLGSLPTAVVAKDREVMTVIETHRLWGRGLGWLDLHLLVSCILSGSELWTLDKRLSRAALLLGVGRR